MDDINDTYIRRGLKNWVAQHRPPVNGRQRLLMTAALPIEHQDRAAQSVSHDLTSIVKLLSQQPYEKAIEVTHPWFWMLQLDLTPLRNLA